MMKLMPVACSKGSDIASFPADDAPFHFIIGNSDRVDSRFGDAGDGQAVDGRGNNSAGFLFRFFFGFFFNAPDQEGPTRF